ncbi:MAG: hypothetical protein QM762_07725, partial [Chryseolinea sp.]
FMYIYFVQSSCWDIGKHDESEQHLLIETSWNRRSDALELKAPGLSEKTMVTSPVRRLKKPRLVQTSSIWPARCLNSRPMTAKSWGDSPTSCEPGRSREDESWHYAMTS